MWAAHRNELLHPDINPKEITQGVHMEFSGQFSTIAKFDWNVENNFFA